jgi:DNA-binding Lrp family transcriptional regulator
MIDELDLALVEALRVDPRAPWSKLAEPLGVDQATLSRRWSRLSAEGDAWVTCYPSAEKFGVGLTALVCVECQAGSVGAVAETLAADPQTPTVQVVSGDADLLLTVAGLEPGQITAYVLDRVGRIPGVLRTRTAFVERLVREGSTWHEGALDRSQRMAIGGAPTTHSPGPPLRDMLADRPLMQALGSDGRMSFAELSARAGMPESTVRRRVGELRSSGRLVLRCDASPRLSGQAVSTTLWLDVPAADLPATASWFAEQPATRMCAITAGSRSNVAAGVMTHQMSDGRRIEAALGQRLPSARVLERQLTLRTVKLVGHLLDAQGRARGYVPIDPWHGSE